MYIIIMHFSQKMYMEKFIMIFFIYFFIIIYLLYYHQNKAIFRYLIYIQLMTKETPP